MCSRVTNRVLSTVAVIATLGGGTAASISASTAASPITTVPVLHPASDAARPTSASRRAIAGILLRCAEPRGERCVVLAPQDRKRNVCKNPTVLGLEQPAEHVGD